MAEALRRTAAVLDRRVTAGIVASYDGFYPTMAAWRNDGATAAEPEPAGNKSDGPRIYGLKKPHRHLAAWGFCCNRFLRCRWSAWSKIRLSPNGSSHIRFEVGRALGLPPSTGAITARPQNKHRLPPFKKPDACRSGTAKLPVFISFHFR